MLVGALNKDKKKASIFRRFLRFFKTNPDTSLLDRAINNMPHGICMFDDKGTLELTNRHLARILGRSEESLLGSSVENIIACLVSESGVSVKDGDIILKCVNGESSNPVHIFEVTGKIKRTIKFRSSRSAGDKLVITFEDITRDVMAASKIDYMTRFDKLTGLLNREQFTTLLEHRLSTIKNDDGCSVLMVNMHRFRNINESRGYRFGDLLLVAATERLKKIIGQTGKCARYAGDEFAIIVNGKDALDMSKVLADSITDAFKQPFEIEGEFVQLSCCIGVSGRCNGKNRGECLLKHADLALDWAKKEGRDEWRVFTDDLLIELVKQREIEHDLRQALNNNQLEAFFQPLICVKERRVSTCEALVRWQHPTLGNVPPSEFIPIAEEIGMISEIGAWMIRESCLACASWPVQTQVAVNLSPLQFKEGDIVGTIRNALELSGLQANRLQLEITESLLMEEMNDVVAKLEELKQMGITIALDDFGTGYSSLSYLNNLPLHKVKIDRSFITGIQENSKSLTLIKAIAGLGRQLGLNVVVEGVETSEELEILLNNAEIDEVQGFLFSRPVNKIKIAELLNMSLPANREMLLPINYPEIRAA